jgi:hypothetical protein
VQFNKEEQALQLDWHDWQLPFEGKKPAEQEVVQYPR